MGITMKHFKIDGPDFSEHNGIIDWEKIKNNFSIIRVGYGLTIDKKFRINWAAARGKTKRAPYWYGDYYSNWYNPKSAAYGLSDVAWGWKQAEVCWAALKDDPEGIVFLDVENGGKSYSTPLTDPITRDHAETIFRAFLERIDELNGKTNGIYSSVGWLSWFYTWFRNRPLWVAWYNDVTVEDVFYAVSRYGWEGSVLMWQFSSTEILAGVSGKVDGNGWIGTEAQYCTTFSISSSEDYQDDESSIITSNSEVQSCVITASALSIRKEPSKQSKFLGSRLNGTPVSVSTLIIQGPGSSKGWVKVDGQDEYLSLDWLEKVETK